MVVMGIQILNYKECRKKRRKITTFEAREETNDGGKGEEY